MEEAMLTGMQVKEKLSKENVETVWQLQANL